MNIIKIKNINKTNKIKQKIKSETKWSIEGISGRRKRNMGRVRELEKLNQNYENIFENYSFIVISSVRKRSNSFSPCFV